MTRDLGPYTPDRHTAVQVIEIMPPGVQTGLRDERVHEPDAMPLDEYIAETMALLTEEPEATEIVVDATNRSGSPNRRRVRAALYRLQHVTLALTGGGAASQRYANQTLSTPPRAPRPHWQRSPKPSVTVGETDGGKTGRPLR